MKTHFIAFILLLNSVACSPSTEELANREKRRADSIILSVQQEMLARQAAADRQKAIADSIAAVVEQEILKQQVEAQNRELLTEQLVALRAQLEVEETKLNDLKQFRLLRSKDEKERQVGNQARVVERLRAQIDEIQKEVSY